MTYSIIGILASILLVITNRDVLWKTDGSTLTRTQRVYRMFLLGVMCYYVTDLLWGILYDAKMITVLFADTSIHFAAMVGAVMLWTHYVVYYLNTGKVFGQILKITGRAFFVLEVIFIVVNFFYPILFWFDQDDVYHAGIARYITLLIQIILFFGTSVYTLAVASKAKDRVRRRHITIGLFGIAMMLLITVQVFFPLWPLYAMGYMLGTSLLHTFVVEDEKEEARRELLESREALKGALADAERANKAKTLFLSNMSHEIRTPMNAIIGLNDIAMNDPTASEEVKTYLRKSGDSAQHLLGIINDILDMTRIESGHMTIKKEEFCLTEALDQINTMISGQCEAKGITYTCKKADGIGDYYVGDILKLKQVLINILGNAVKFTPEGGSVDFTIEEGEKYSQKAVLIFTVKDTGIGMSPEYIEHIYDAFSQEDASPAAHYGSTGLGMPITKSIVDLMNGNIEVASEKGKGTTFKVTVTLDEAASDGKHEAIASEKRDIELKGRRVLLAEDVPVNAEIMEMILSSKEMEVDLAANGREAVELFEKHEPGYYDAVLMDMRMPEMDGLEATRTIRGMDREDAKKIPVIALTANAFDEDVEQSMQAGLNAHLAKPVEPDVLFETLDRLIK